MNARKTACLILAFALFLFYFAGCSTMNTIMGWVNFWHSDETQGDLEGKAVSQFVSTVRSRPGNPDSHYLLACYYQERGNHKEAIEEFKKVVFIDPSYVKAYNGLGVSYDLMGDFPKAVESYETALRLNPDLDYVHNNLGYSYLLQQNPEGAVAAFQRAIKLNGNDKRFHNNLGLAYGEKGRFDLALAEFQKAGNEAKAHYNIAQIYYKKGLYVEAMAHYTMSLTLDPLLTSARTALEATSALSRVFHADSKSVNTEKQVTPDLPVEIRPSSPITNEVGEEILAKESSLPSSGAGVGLQSPPSPLGGEGLHPQETPPISNGHAETSAQLSAAALISPPAEEPKPEERAVLTVPVQLNTQKVEMQKSSPQDPKVEIKNLASLRGVEIEISNGNGVSRMARRVGRYLKGKGLKVVRLTNADNFNHAGTRIFYHKGYDGQAGYVAGQLGVRRGGEEVKKLGRPNIKMKVLIGKDLISKEKLFADEGG